jgi:hypothetical protein
MTPRLQEWIHQLEEGAGARYIVRAAALLGLLALALFYNQRQFQNFSAPEAMDQAQVARNLAEGKGYTTQFIRPVSLYLIQKHQGSASLPLALPHPDLANPPVYPYVLAGLMTVAPFDFQPVKPAEFQKYQPEVLIAWLNQGLFVLALWLVFRLARKLFDEPVAWLSVIALGGAELFWRFSVSGLSTMLLLVIFLMLVSCLVAVEHGDRVQAWGPVKMLFMAAVVGALVGVGGLTRYAFAWVILPVIAFFGFALERRRAAVVLVAAVAYLAVLTPWLARNYQLCGHLFGTAGLAIYQETGTFPGNRLERALNPENSAIKSDWGKIDTDQYEHKLLANTSRIMQNELPKLGGSWVTAFFLVGLLVPFNNPALTRLRYFLLLCLALLTGVQALGRTHLSELVPDLNSENLLVLLAPLVFVYGVGLFFMLLDPLASPLAPVRRWVKTGFSALAVAPLLFSLWLPRPGPVAYPPYYPPIIQEGAGWLAPDELMMSDMPWAVAWYGRRSCLWLPWDLPDFQTLHRQRPVRALYLTPLTMDTKFLSQMMQNRDSVWGKFALDSALKEEIPDGFPLKHAFTSWFPDQLFLTDRPRWLAPPK